MEVIKGQVGEIYSPHQCDLNHLASYQQENEDCLKGRLM